MIGSFGNVVFGVSDKRMLTFPSLSHSVAANVEAHRVAGASPIAVFIGPGDETVSFEMTLSADRGVNPLVEAEKLRRMCRAGERYPLIIGPAPVGKPGSKWLVSEIGEERLDVDNQGRTVRSHISVSLQLSPDYPVAIARTGSVAKSNVERRRVA